MTWRTIDWLSRLSRLNRCQSTDWLEFAQSNLGRGPRRGAVAHIRHKVPIDGYNSAPQIHPLSVDRYPNPTSCLIPAGPVRPMMPNGIRNSGSDLPFLPQCTGQTDRRTYVRIDRPTDRPRESLTTLGRCAARATRPNNIRWMYYLLCCNCMV